MRIFVIFSVFEVICCGKFFWLTVLIVKTLVSFGLVAIHCFVSEMRNVV